MEEPRRGLVDLHAHVLPGLDDGPSDLDGALELLRLLRDDGVRTVVATPHVAPGFFWPYDSTVVEKKLVELRGAAAQAGLDLEIHGGAELYLSLDLVPLAQEGRLPTLGDSRCILVELPRNEAPFWAFEVLQRLQRCGYQPILAHPELNHAVRADAELPGDLARQGVLLQVDAGSLTGRWGQSVASYALGLLQAGLAQVVASDTHSAARPPELRAARAELEKHLGEKAREWLQLTPLALLRGYAMPTQVLPKAKPEFRSHGGVAAAHAF